MSTTAQRSLRIGEVAELTGVTPRTIRYYEEIGLLPASAPREQGKHRSYGEADVARIREIVRLRDLLGLSLEQLSELLEAEAARAELRREYHQTEDSTARASILEQALDHLDTQLRLVRDRRRELDQLERELLERRDHVRDRLAGHARAERAQPEDDQGEKPGA